MKSSLLHLLMFASKKAVHIFLIQVIAMQLLFANESSSQNLKDVEIGFEMQDASLEDVFTELERLTSFKFGYDRKILNEKIRFDFHEPSTNLEEVLLRVAEKAQLKFKRINGHILVLKDSDRKGSPKIEVLDDRNIQGKVSDDRGEPLVGATVQVKNTTIGTVTDIDGNFRLNIPDNAQTLLVSYIGFQAREVSVGSLTSFEIKLEPDISALQEVVIVGYGTQEKYAVTGAVTSIKSKQFDDRPITQTSQALAGLAPGVYVNNNTGEAGNDQPNILIRGVGTLNNSNPLILVDGIEAPFNNINPKDIESIEVLKDAASAAIYGSRAANGVILITTKKGSYNSAPVISYDFYGGVGNPTVLPDMVTNPRQYMELYREATENGGGTVAFDESDIQRYEAIGPTDWLDQIFNSNASIFSHAASVRGGAEDVSYFVSLGYLDQESIIRGNQDYQRYNGRLNLAAKPHEKFSVGTNLALAIDEGNLAVKSEGAFGGLDINSLTAKGSLAFESALVQHPIVPVYTPLGEYATLERALAIQRDRNNGQAILDNEQLNLRSTDVLGNAFAEFEILKDWKVKATLGVNYQFNDLLDTRRAFNIVDPVTENIIRSWNTFFGNSTLTQQTQELLNITTWLQSDYHKTIGQHSFDVLVGFNQETSDQRRTTIRQADFGSSDLVTLGNGATTTHSLRNQGEWTLRSFFGRVNYAFDERYLLEFNLRRDGSSRFGSNNRWATFPSVSGGWIISNEAFWPQNDVVSNLKIRGSWGLLGNQNTAFYPFASQVSLDQNYNVNGELVSGAGLTRLGTEDLRWEESEMTDIGINIDLFDFRLGIEADYFFKETRDILTALPNSLASGIPEPTIVNAATVQNEGWEAAVNFNNDFNGFQIGLKANVTYVTNEITAINPELSGDDDRVSLQGSNNVWLIRGQPINSIFGYKVAGIFQSSEEINSAPDHSFFGDAQPGDFRMTDINDDGVINEDDRTVIGNRQPKWFYGFAAELQWKGFDFSALFQGIGKAETYLGRHVGPFPFAGLREFWTDRWTEENPSATMPRLWIDRSGYNGSTVVSKPASFWVEDRAYFRMKNIQLGYTLPDRLFANNFVGGVRVFVNGQNLWTITDFANGDFDPERIDTEVHATSALPQVKTVTGGINVKF